MENNILYRELLKHLQDEIKPFLETSSYHKKGDNHQMIVR